MRKFFYISVIFIIVISIISCEKEVFNSALEVEEIKRNITLFLDSKPSGAQIYINDKNSGFKTPAKLYWLNEGINKITLKLDLFEDSTLYVSLSDANNNFIFVDYCLNSDRYGKVYSTSYPQYANIFLNDSATGEYTPATLKRLFFGTYKV